MTNEISTAEPEGLRAAILEHRERFRAWFGDADGVRLFYSPGRVNLMGAHLDYSGGPVMPTAIDRGTFFAVRPRADRVLSLATLREGESFEGSVDELPDKARGRWFDYPLGTLRHMTRGVRVPTGVEVLFGGNLPIGAGLSSSASICVGTARALADLWEMDVSIEDCIDAALYGEREFVGVSCGIMDPFAVGLTRPGNLLWVDCKDRTVEHLPIDTDAVTIAVADSGIRRGLAQVAFNERVAECAEAFARLREHVPGATCLRDVPAAVVEAHAGELAPNVLERARHVASEVERTFAARAALEVGDVVTFGAAISAAHASLRDRYQVSVPELDALVESACAWDGVLGARLTGAGFGGCIVVLLRRDACDGFADHLRADYERRFGRQTAVDFFQGDHGPRELRL